MSRIAFLTLSLAITSSLASCVDSGQNIDDPEIDTVESALSIVPFTGTWLYGPLIPLSTTCTVPGIIHGESGPFRIDTVTATSFRVSPRDLTAPFTCSYNEGTFACPNRLTATLDLRPALDVKLTMKVTVTGLMTDSKHARGKQDALITCTGSLCSLFGTMPCGYVDTFTVSAL